MLELYDILCDSQGNHKEQPIVDTHKILIMISKLTTTKSNQIIKTAKEKGTKAP